MPIKRRETEDADAKDGMRVLFKLSVFDRSQVGPIEDMPLAPPSEPLTGD